MANSVFSARRQMPTDEDYEHELQDLWAGLTDEERAWCEALSPGISAQQGLGALHKFFGDFFRAFDVYTKERFGVDLKQLCLKVADRRCELRPQDVAAIRIRRIYEGTAMRKLARMYDVSVSTVWNILHDRYWKR